MKNKDLELWALVRELTFKHAALAGLSLWKVKAPMKKWRGQYHGSCSKRGLIRIAIRAHKGKRHEPYQIIDTIAHELAHLLYPHHRAEWFKLHVKILNEIVNCSDYEKLRETCGRQK